MVHFFVAIIYNMHTFRWTNTLDERTNMHSHRQTNRYTYGQTDTNIETNSETITMNRQTHTYPEILKQCVRAWRIIFICIVQILIKFLGFVLVGEEHFIEIILFRFFFISTHRISENRFIYWSSRPYKKKKEIEILTSHCQCLGVETG